MVNCRVKETILEENDQLGGGMNVWIQFKFFPWMMANPNITVHKGVKFRKIHDKGVTIKNQEGIIVEVEADIVMIIEKDRKNYHLYDALKGKVPEIHIIGDAKEDNNTWLEGTVHDGITVGMKE